MINTCAQGSKSRLSVFVPVEQCPGDPAINYVPAYRFKMTLVGQDKEIGRIELRVGHTCHLVMYGGHLAYGVDPDYSRGVS